MKTLNQWLFSLLIAVTQKRMKLNPFQPHIIHALYAELSRTHLCLEVGSLFVYTNTYTKQQGNPQPCYSEMPDTETGHYFLSFYLKQSVSESWGYITMLNFSSDVPRSKLTFSFDVSINKKMCLHFVCVQFSVPGREDEENEPPEPTWAHSMVATSSSEAAATLGPFLSTLENMKTRTPSPGLILHQDNLVHKGKRCLAINCCTCHGKQAQERWSLKSHLKKNAMTLTREDKRYFPLGYIQTCKLAGCGINLIIKVLKLLLLFQIECRQKRLCSVCHSPVAPIILHVAFIHVSI